MLSNILREGVKKKRFFGTLSQTMGRWGSKVPNSLVKITYQLFLGLCPKIGVAVGGWGPVLKVDAHGAHVRRTKESWEDQKAG